MINEFKLFMKQVFKVNEDTGIILIFMLSISIIEIWLQDTFVMMWFMLIISIIAIYINFKFYLDEKRMFVKQEMISEKNMNNKQKMKELEIQW